MFKLTRLALFLLLVIASPVLAQRFEPRGADFVLAQGGHEIFFRTPGTLRVGPVGGPQVSLSLFLWHDNWVYKRLDSGKVEAGPLLDERGWLRQSGVWVADKDATPLKYMMALEPTRDGAILHLQTEKTAPLKLTNGIWLSAYLARKDFTPQSQAYARPTAHALLGKPLAGDCDALLIETAPGHAVSLAPEGFSQVRSQGGETDQNFEMQLRPGDFTVGEKAQVSLKIGFDAMPAEFPGEIKPSREPLSIGGVTKGGVRAGKKELTVDLHGTWDNPFDPDDVRLDAVVTSAGGRSFTVPGFYQVDYRRETRGNSEIMVPQGKGRWCVRLATNEAGAVRYRLVATDRSGKVSKDTETVMIPKSKSKGFIRQSRVDPHYLQFENGEGFLPIGHNLPIYHSSGQTGAVAIRKMATAGENYNRWWMSSSGFGIEWEEKLGWYRQPTAARLDAMLDLADELDFRYMLCLDTHQDFREGGWKTNPFNKANGGPCATVSEWFTNVAARNLYKKRLRYIVARWGYSTNILTWEFGNEMEGWADTNDTTKIAWHREMAAYLADLDPYKHLLTTSWWSNTGPKECWDIAQLGIVQTHCYTNNDANVGEQVRDFCLHQWNGFQKPHIFGEFGIRSQGTTADKDPQGWGLHNAFWAAIASGASGNAMPWWHEDYIEPNDLYFHFTSIADFTKGLPFGSAKWEQVPLVSATYLRSPTPPVARDAILIPSSTWGKAPASNFEVQGDGKINDATALHQLLHGTGHADLQNPPVFTVNYPAPGKFIVSVGKVSNGGLLKIWVDDVLKTQRAFPTGEGIGKQSQYQAQWKLWESVYDEDVALAIPAGRHRIKVSNEGADWMSITRYVFTGAQVLSQPNLLVAALRASTGQSIVWLQNRDSDWFNQQRQQVSEVPPSRVTLGGFADGAYEVQWWETWKAKPLRTERIFAKNGQLELMPGIITTDVAAKIRAAQ